MPLWDVAVDGKCACSDVPLWDRDVGGKCTCAQMISIATVE